MSSTNVHSEQENIQIVGGQTIPTEKEIEIPPKSVGKGPASLDVKLGEGIEIKAGKSELQKDGRAIDENGEIVAIFDPRDMAYLIEKQRVQAEEGLEI